MTISAIDPAARPEAADSSTRERERSELRGVAAADVSPEAIRSAVETNGQVVFGGRSLEFTYDDDIRRVVVTIRSADTEEIVRQIPPEDYVRFVARFREMLGVVLDEVV